MRVAEPTVRRWTVDEYYRLAEMGFIAPDERVELIEGEIIQMSPLNPPHAFGSGKVQSFLLRVFGEDWVVRVGLPLRLQEDSEPEPDFAVVRGRLEDFLTGHPTTAELVVEVSDSSLSFDLGQKAALYAGAGIPDYWVLNLPGRALVVHRDPDPATRRYRDVQSYGEAESAAPLAAPGVTVAVRDLLP
jgi:Uma2 family endonuclease